MTAKHILEGVTQVGRLRNHYHCAVFLELDPAAVSRMCRGAQPGMSLVTLDHIQRKTEIPIETLFAWYRLPHGAALGRITGQCPTAQ